MDYKQLLNEEQYPAVVHTEGAVLVSAGAGSGKTRLLTHRIAYLITDKHVAAENILAITFTNKAAGEMRERVQNLTTFGNRVTVCTFHSLCVRLLRKYISAMPGFTENFSIYSDSDRDKILKRVYAEMNITDSEVKDKVEYHIGKCKNENMSIEQYVQDISYLPISKWVLNAYELYQKYLRESNAMDFDDLLTNAYNILSTSKEVLDDVQMQYKYLHIDEFQDTNKVQYDIVRLIAKKYGNIMVVGDEDQSIYGWRGANVENLFNFQKDFKDCAIFKLEQNYRSTKRIIFHANKLIKHNNERLDKTLFTDNPTGEEVEFHSAYDEQAEADYVVRQIIRMHSEGVKYNQMAILMRINAFSRPFEEKLLMYNIPHKIYGGFKFFERVEVKNVLAYFIATINPRDEQNLLRIINFPKRGIGATSVEYMQTAGRDNNISLREVIDNVDKFAFTNALISKVLPLKEVLSTIKSEVDTLSLTDFSARVVEIAGIMNAYNDDEEIERKMNINSLLQSIKEFDENNTDATVGSYIESVTLISEFDNGDQSDAITIASVHSAKGLEFDTVFVVGAEEKYFPIVRNSGDADLEEERRLMYVAITRARQKLYITGSRSRFLYNKREDSLPSRFINEMGLIVEKQKPAEPLKYQHHQTMKPAKEENPQRLSKSEALIGTRVSHPHFGKGVITRTDAIQENGAITISFDSFGLKTLSLEYAPISKI